MDAEIELGGAYFETEDMTSAELKVMELAMSS